MNHCDVLSDNMTAYRNLYCYLEGNFVRCEVSHVSRASNEEADILANIGSQCLPIPLGVFWEEIIKRSIQNTKYSGLKKQKTQKEDSGAVTVAEEDSLEPEEVMMVKVTLMQPYLAYRLHKTLPEDIVEARRIVRRSRAFVVIKGELYKKNISGVLQRRFTPQEGQAILHDIHAGVLRSSC
jgi:hypothetical protein